MPVKIHAVNTKSKSELLNFNIVITNASGFWEEVFVKENIIVNTCLQSGKYEITVTKDLFLQGKRMIYIKADTLNNYTFEIDSIGYPQCRLFYGVYFESKKCVLTNAIKDSLQGLLKTMKDNPNIVVELVSSTDSKGDAKDNMKVSECYASVVRNYLIDHGINPYRLVVIATGESLLTNRCKDGVKCTEAEHRMNRYVSYKISSFDFEE